MSCFNLRRMYDEERDVEWFMENIMTAGLMKFFDNSVAVFIDADSNF